MTSITAMNKASAFAFGSASARPGARRPAPRRLAPLRANPFIGETNDPEKTKARKEQKVSHTPKILKNMEFSDCLRSFLKRFRVRAILIIRELPSSTSSRGLNAIVTREMRAVRQ